MWSIQILQNFAIAFFEATEGRPADVVLDTVGTDFGEAALRSIEWRSQILIVGFAGGEIPQIPAQYILNKFCSVSGVWWGRSYFEKEPAGYLAIMESIVTMCAEPKVRPHVSKSLNLQNVKQGLIDLAANKITGRMAIDFRS